MFDPERENIDVVPIASTSSDALQVSMISSSSDDTPDDEGILPTTSGQVSSNLLLSDSDNFH